MDADSLFEFFLIDVQMDACMETSRIKQAISTVQLFVQRCLLGLEDTGTAYANGALDRDRWDWMQKYRVWEANRKVFLYPENWIEPSCATTRARFTRSSNRSCCRRTSTRRRSQDALKNYLFKVDEVANLKVVGLFLEIEDREAQAARLRPNPQCTLLLLLPLLRHRRSRTGIRGKRCRSISRVMTSRTPTEVRLRRTART